MTGFSDADAAHMRRALTLAERGRFGADPNPLVGCVLVNDGVVVGEGWHQRVGGAHAEAHAIDAAQAFDPSTARTRGATAYVTLEPCCHYGRTPPCTDALLAAGVTRVVAAMVDPDPRVAGRGLQRLRAAGVTVECGLLEPQARALNPGYIARLTRGRPWLRLKLAMTLDGRTATAGGDSQWITGPAARADVQRLRARSSAVLSGVATVLSDDPALNVRLSETSADQLITADAGSAPRQPLRVILDSTLRTPPQARTLRLPGEVLILTAADADGDAARALRRAGAAVHALPAGDGGVALPAALGYLAGRGCNEVHTECGARLAGALLAQGLVDELVVYMAPKLLGCAARGLLELPGLERLGDAIGLTVNDIRPVGDDWRIDATPAR